MWRFPIQNHSTQSTTQKRRNKAKYLTWNSIRLKFAETTCMLNPVKSLRYIKSYSSSSPRSVKSPRNYIRYNCKNICSLLRRPIPILKIRKRPHFSRWSAILLFTRFSKTLLATESILSGRYFFAVDLSPTFLNTGSTNETFQQSGKQDSFRHLLKSSARM